MELGVSYASAQHAVLLLQASLLAILRQKNIYDKLPPRENPSLWKTN